jgi:hypothetical protein
MMRARGANARLHGKFEATYGVPPSGNYIQFPFVQSNIGPEQGLLESDLLGQGREGFDPTLDVLNNDGDVTVPVDVRNVGHWLNLLLGAATTSASVSAAGDIVFSALPAANSTITINGTVFTFVSGAPSGNQIQIGADVEATVDNAVTVLNASVIAGVALATYSKVDTDTLHIVHDTGGTTGNTFTIAASDDSNGEASNSTLVGGGNKHTFTSGASSLPAMSIETAMPDVPAYQMNYGMRGNMLKVELQRRGLLNAVISLIGKGAKAVAGTSGAGTPTALTVARFAQATGQIKKDGAQLGSVVAANFAFSNNLDKVETIQPDSEIEDADPGQATASGNVTVRFKDQVLMDAATGRDPIELSFNWNFEGFTLTVTFPRVLLPRPKTPITGPNGIQASFDWQGSGADGHVMTVDLINDVASYAAAAV